MPITSTRYRFRRRRTGSDIPPSHSSPWLTLSKSAQQSSSLYSFHEKKNVHSDLCNRRHQSDRYVSVKEAWRKPKGIDNRVRRRFKGQTPMPKVFHLCYFVLIKMLIMLSNRLATEATKRFACIVPPSNITTKFLSPDSPPSP